MSKAGNPVMLHNMQYEAFALAGGSFACNSLPSELIEDYKKGVYTAPAYSQ